MYSMHGKEDGYMLCTYFFILLYNDKIRHCNAHTQIDIETVQTSCGRLNIDFGAP